jgi:hypothetical protein
LVRPIPAGQPVPQVEFPQPVMGPDKELRTPGIGVTGPVTEKPVATSIPVEQLLQSLKQAANTSLTSGNAASGLANSSWQPQTQLATPGMPGASPGLPAEPSGSKPSK